MSRTTHKGMTRTGKDVHVVYGYQSPHFPGKVDYDAACGVNNNRGGHWAFVPDTTPATCERCSKVTG